jgi:hypothetical protein
MREGNGSRLERSGHASPDPSATACRAAAPPRHPGDRSAARTAERNPGPSSIRETDLANHAEDRFRRHGTIQERLAVALGNDLPPLVRVSRRDESVGHRAIAAPEDNHFADARGLCAELDEEPAPGRNQREHAPAGGVEPRRTAV